jgi:hypothetical protein
MNGMSQSCADMTQRLSAARNETADLIRKTTALQVRRALLRITHALIHPSASRRYYTHDSAAATIFALFQSERQQMQLRGAVLSHFVAQYQLAPSEEAILTGRAAFGDGFFHALRRVQRIHRDCRRLLGTQHQKAGLDIMESMAALQETAYERLYRWTQGVCGWEVSAASLPGPLFPSSRPITSPIIFFPQPHVAP